MRMGRVVVRGGVGVLLAASLAAWGGGPAIGAAAGVERFVIVPASSTASYRVAETFLQDNRFNEAAGTTHAIDGEIALDRARPTQSRVGPIRVDLPSLASDDARRDNAIRHRWLESSVYPTAVFTSTAVRGLPSVYVDGRDTPVEIDGVLLVHDTSRLVTFTGTVRLSGDTLTGILSTTVRLTDFGVQPPSLMILRAEDRAVVTIRFVATRAPGAS